MTPEGRDETDRQGAAQEAEQEAAEAAERRRRARRRAEVFGDVLPESTADDVDEGSPGRDGTDRDAELRRNVPPHHG